MITNTVFHDCDTEQAVQNMIAEGGPVYPTAETNEADAQFAQFAEDFGFSIR